MPRITPLASWLVIVVAVSGCASRDPLARVELAKTTGKVVWANHPVQGLLVVLHPADGSPQKTPVQPTGFVQEDGSFAITCYELADGAPPGEYVVTFREAPRPDGSKPLKLPPAKYRDPKHSPLKVTIEGKRTNELVDMVIEEQ